MQQEEWLMISKGSEWRRWNLHLHSKYSLESRTKMEIEEFFRSVVNNEISMFSITDHSNVDALDEIWEVYGNGSCEKGCYKELVDFLPGIEFKTDKGKRGVHLISIFPKEIKIGNSSKKATEQCIANHFIESLINNEDISIFEANPIENVNNIVYFKNQIKKSNINTTKKKNILNN